MSYVFATADDARLQHDVIHASRCARLSSRRPPHLTAVLYTFQGGRAIVTPSTISEIFLPL